MPYKSHLFICTNSPDNPAKCGAKGSETLRKKLKESCKEKFGADVRVNAAGCLGACERGITAVVYPQNHWLYELTDQDEPTLLEAVRSSLKSQDR